MARVVRTPLAKCDLKEIGRYIAHQSQSLIAAERFLDSIDSKCALYSAEREMGELCPDLAPQVRRFTVGNYVVLYRGIRTGIEVLRVLHGSRDIPSAWENE